MPKERRNNSTEPTVKSEIKRLYLRVGKELIRRENYFTSKSDSWQDSSAGDNYTTITESYKEFHDSISDAMVSFGIKMKKKY